ncbi:EAL and HDOD domain-containing protein [Sulfurospirillum arcachonense]|uniref:EAL and HDOD domain-containing protein n=1 Tax=Sulfurospirillum arcachonense TaxID=57666 RepID=UPI0004686BD8|nr:EAL domain-containing protein [Sulfurospirillum arcachonense]
MIRDIYIAKQPIIDVNNEIYGYELLFRTIDNNGSMHALFEDELLATAKVLVNALNHFGISSLVNDSLAFINIDQEFLFDPILFNIPKDRFILEILEDTILDKKTIERIKMLKEQGYKFALDDVHSNDGFIERFIPIFPYIDILKLDVSLIKENAIEKYLKSFKKYNFELLAEKVETQEDYELFKAYGCILFQGYFFAKPDVLQKKSIDPEFKKIFQLINLLDDENIATKQIVKELENEIELTIQLLRFINSGFIGLKKEVTSVNHVLSLLGKKPLKQWLLLIAFAKSMDSEIKVEKNPLFNLALNRSKIMASIVKLMKNTSCDIHEASFVGILSLIDVILKIPLDTILEEISLGNHVKEALLYRKGELGKLLKLVIAIEKLDMQKVDKILDDIHITNLQLNKILQESYVHS